MEKNIKLASKVIDDEEKFIGRVLFSGTSIISNGEFASYKLKNKNICFFLNCMIDVLSSVSMLGCRNFSHSLIGSIDGLIDYYDKILLLFESKDKRPTISKYKIDYVRNAIKTNQVISAMDKQRYQVLLKDDNDINFIENLKLIRCSLVENDYFENVSDKLYDYMTKENSDSDFDNIYLFTIEYFALLIDYVGISIFEIKRLIRDTYRQFFKYKQEKVFLTLFEKFVQSYKQNVTYTVYVRMDKDFDEKLLTSLKHSNNNNFIIYSTSGLEKYFNSININNQVTFQKIKKQYFEIRDNKYYLSAKFEAKDTWQAIKWFRQNIVQPYSGSMLYSGIKVSSQGNYIVLEEKDNKKFINEYKFFDDVFKPLSQDRIDYLDVFKRYVIDSKNSDINRVIDEAVQLLPYYKTSDSILTKFTNTWFALETLFRNASETIVKSLEDYASYLVADRLISGYIYVTAVQIKKMYSNFEKYSNNFIENIFINYKNYNINDCDYLFWKYNKIVLMTDQYEQLYSSKLIEARELLMNAYFLRNKQFHGTKNSQLENMSGFLYDIVNDTISFYIDYLDVYKNSDINLKSLFNYMKNINIIKSSLIKQESESINKICVMYDAVRKL